MISPAGAALELRGISKRFGDTHALTEVDFAARRGRVHALLGENGAGKSTLMNVAFGVQRPDAGTIRVGGADAAYTGRPHQGVGMVHQHLSLVPAMTAVENMELGLAGPRQPGAARRRLQELSVASGLAVPPDLLVRDMSIVQQQRLEILKALGRDASVLIMDEPTAVLAPAEVTDLLQWVRAFASNGNTVVLVTHKLREALSVADDVTILRRGRVSWTGSSAGATMEQLAQAIFPDGAATSSRELSPSSGDVCVRARDLLLRSARGVEIFPSTFEICRGEIVGIAAVEGAGHRALLAALGGLRPDAAAALELPDRIAYIPADRRRDAVVPSFSLTENVALRGLAARRGVMPWPALRARTGAIIERFGIAAPSADVPVGVLSGGNQQRLVIGRELEDATDLVVADNPTRGLDLNATAFVHEQLRAAARGGAAVVVHSSDLDEVLALATRVLVVFAGTVRAIDGDRDAIGRAMLGSG